MIHQVLTSSRGFLRALASRRATLALALLVLVVSVHTEAAGETVSFCQSNCETMRLLLGGDERLTVEIHRTDAGSTCSGGLRQPVGSLVLSSDRREALVSLPIAARDAWAVVLAPEREASCGVRRPAAVIAPTAAHELRYLRTESPGAIHGVVSDLEEKRRAGAIVTLRPREPAACSEVRLCAHARPELAKSAPKPSPREWSDTTGDTGAFRFDGIPAGAYDLTISTPESTSRASDLVYVADGRDFDLGVLPQRIEGAIQGEIGTEDELLFPEDVEMFPLDRSKIPKDPAPIGDVAFRFDGVEPGRYVLFGRRQGERVLAGRVEVFAGRTAKVKLSEKAAIVRGRVMASGKPAEGKVWIHDREGPASRWVVSEGTEPLELAAVDGESLVALALIEEGAERRVAVVDVPRSAAGPNSDWAIEVPSGGWVFRLTWPDGRPLDSIFRVSIKKSGESATIQQSTLRAGGFVELRAKLPAGRYEAVVDGRLPNGPFQAVIPLPPAFPGTEGIFLELTVPDRPGRELFVVDSSGWRSSGARLGVVSGGVWRFEDADAEGKVIWRSSAASWSDSWILVSGRPPARTREVKLAHERDSRLVADEVPGHRLDLELRRADGAPLEGARLLLDSPTIPADVVLEWLRLGGQSVSSGKNGRIVINHLPEGDWNLTVAVGPEGPNELRFGPTVVELSRDVELALEIDAPAGTAPPPAR